jgi:hypothetical protein
VISSSKPINEVLLRGKNESNRASSSSMLMSRAETQTCNSGDQLVIALLTTDLQIFCLYMAERTKSLMLFWLFNHKSP